MSYNKLLLFSMFACMSFSLQINGQTLITINDLIKVKKDTIFKIKSETYESKHGNVIILRNVNNTLDKKKRSNNVAYLEEPKRHNNFLKLVFPPHRFDELAKSNVTFFVRAICDSIGNILECTFLISNRAESIKLEELEKFEKLMKTDYKEKFKKVTPGVEDYEIIYPFNFGLTPAQQRRQKKLYNNFKEQ